MSVATSCSYQPPDAVLDSLALEPLLEQVDGPSMFKYTGKEATYTGRSCKVYGQSSLDVPVRISAPGSIVEYTIEKKSYDFGLGISAKLDQGGVTTVKEMGPFDGNIQMSQQQGSKTVSDQVLVGAGSVPCTLNFKFENKMSWIVELSYKIRVIPPDRNVLLEGRRRRAKACMQTLDYDVGRTNQRLNEVNSEKNALERDVQALAQQFRSIEGSLRSMNENDGVNSSGGGSFGGVPNGANAFSNNNNSFNSERSDSSNLAGNNNNNFSGQGSQQMQQQRQVNTQSSSFAMPAASSTSPSSGSSPFSSGGTNRGTSPFPPSGGGGQPFPTRSSSFE